MKRCSVLLRFVFYLFDFLFPNCCRGCGKIFEAKMQIKQGDFKQSLCQDCLKNLVVIDEKNCCRHCGYPIEKNEVLDRLFKKSVECPSCEGKKRFFNIARSAFQYNGVVRKMLLSLKFSFQTEGISYIAENLVKIYNQMPKADIVCFVPITNRKLFFNGFNHAGLIANGFFSLLQKQNGYKNEIYCRDLLIKNKKTIQSKKLSREGRMIKIHHIEVNKKYKTKDCIEKFSGKTFLIIDDIMTTGGTMNAVADMLKKTFPNCKVECLTFARTMLY